MPMRFTNEELERILKWYKAWRNETGSSIYDTILVSKIKDECNK